MTNLFTPAKIFRFVAVLEAISWAALLVGMGFKYFGGIDTAVRIPGMAHGAIFVLYLAVTVYAAMALNWLNERPTLRLGGFEIRVPVVLLALIASVPPFFTVWFEVWARRNGHLGELSADRSSDDDRDKVSA